MSSNTNPDPVTGELKQHRSLNSITQDMHLLEALLEECEDPDEMQLLLNTFFATDHARLEKLDSYAGLIGQMEARIAFRKSESQRLADLARTDENKVKSLKERLKQYFVAEGIDKPVQTPHYRISLVNNGGKLPVIIEDPMAVPLSYQARDICVEAERMPLLFRAECFLEQAGHREESRIIGDIVSAMTNTDRISFDKASLLESLESGESIPGVRLGERGQRVAIK
jgi:hypothetical protein